MVAKMQGANRDTVNPHCKSCPRVKNHACRSRSLRAVHRGSDRVDAHMRQPYHALREYPWRAAHRAPAAGFSAALSRDGTRPWSRARPARKAARGARALQPDPATAHEQVHGQAGHFGHGWRTVVSAGQTRAAGGGIIEAGDRQVPGTDSPSRCAAASTPRAMSSFDANTAVGRSVRLNNWCAARGRCRTKRTLLDELGVGLQAVRAARPGSPGSGGRWRSGQAPP